jgi:transcriptional regulator with XRE-family HTH domain
MSASGGAKLRREKSGLSQVETAGVVGVVPTTISRWESGKRTPRGSAGIRYGRLLCRLADQQRKADHQEVRCPATDER